MAEELTIPMIMTLLQSEYPNSFVNMDKRTMQLKMNLWEKEFAADDINLVYAAVRLYMEKPERFAPNIGQIQVKPKIGLTFANGLRHILRQDPDVVLVGETRDPETAEIAVRASLTVESVVSSNFKRTYRTTQERAKQVEALPDGIKDMLSGITAGMSIEAHDTRQIEAPKEPARVPAKLEPMIYAAVSQPPKPRDSKTEPYKPLELEEWEKRRDELLQKLTGGQA